MPFQPGVSGNPSGRPRRAIAHVVRKQEFRRSFLKLMQIRDGRIREMDFDEEGKRVWVYPSVSNLIAACVKIMEYTAGKPEQKISLDVVGEAVQPNALQLVLNRPSGGQITDAERPAIVLSAQPYQPKSEPSADIPE